MSFPVLDSTHGTEALALLTDHYKNKVNIKGVLNCITPEVQALEAVFWDIINKFMLVNTPVGDQLNAIGSIVGAQRGALNDADYLRLIVIKIAVNRSQGLSNDLIHIAGLAEGTSGPTPNYQDIPNNNFLIECWNLMSPQVIWPMMGKARSAGTRGVLHYTTWLDGSDFEFSSFYASSIGEQGFSSFYSASTGGVMAAGQDF